MEKFVYTILWWENPEDDPVPLVLDNDKEDLVAWVLFGEKYDSLFQEEKEIVDKLRQRGHVFHPEWGKFKLKKGYLETF